MGKITRSQRRRPGGAVQKNQGRVPESQRHHIQEPNAACYGKTDGVMEDLISKRTANTTFKRFDKVIYEVARTQQIDALPLLDALEFSCSIASGVGSLLLVLRAQDSEETDDDDVDRRFSRTQVDDLLSLCITSLDLLNSKIEAVADLMSTRYGLQ